MTDRNGLSVSKREMAEYKKTWMFVTTKPDGSPVSFRDWFDMIRVLGVCEIEKYGGDPTDKKDWDRWTRIPREFLDACWDFDKTYDDLRKEYGLLR